MRYAIWALSGFAALWGFGGIVALQWPAMLAVLPFALSALMIFAGRRVPQRRDGGPLSAHVRRVVTIWSLLEFAAIVLAVNLLSHFGLGFATTPAIAIIVGLHFIPLARGIPFPGYYPTAAGVTTAGIVALFLPPPLNISVAAFGAATVLWLTAAWLLARGPSA